MRTLSLLVVGALVAVHRTEAAALIDTDASQIAEAAAYLAKYGWSSQTGARDRSSALVSLSGDIAEFQRFANLKVTGELDAETLEKMRQPRCGVKDRLGPSYRSRRKKRYALQGSRWRIRDLKYKITSWPSKNADRAGVRLAVADAFKAWQKVSSLTFQEVQPREKANIEIKFAAGEHGDGDPFDGRGGTLAHAFFPLYGGDAHFDDSEPWIVEGTRGIDLFMTAAHEFGHSLGLSHSEDDRALMAPFYKPPSKNRDVVKEDDKNAIQELYGPPKNTIPPEEPDMGNGEDSPGTDNDKPSSTNDPILCKDSRPDAMITVTSNPSSPRTYVFKGDLYWRLTPTGIEDGYPQKISDKWDGVPNDLDAAFAWSSANRIYFFKGNQFWRMTSYRMDVGYPKLISKGFPGIPDNVDAAFQWAANGYLYFFKGSQYWKFEHTKEQAVSDRYPRPISVWGGVPNNVDAVMTYSNKKPYFFKKDVYYRYDDINFKVSESEIPYPRSTAKWWFGCDNQPSSMVVSQSNRGDISVEEAYGDAVVGFGEGDAQPRRTENSSSAIYCQPAVLLLSLLSFVLLRLL